MKSLIEELQRRAADLRDKAVYLRMDAERAALNAKKVDLQADELDAAVALLSAESSFDDGFKGVEPKVGSQQGGHDRIVAQLLERKGLEADTSKWPSARVELTAAQESSTQIGELYRIASLDGLADVFPALMKRAATGDAQWTFLNATPPSKDFPFGEPAYIGVKVTPRARASAKTSLQPMES